MARSRLRQHQTFTLLGPTALVHETWLRLLAAGLTDADDRAYLLAYAGRTMRSIIVDHARARLADKRGGGHAEQPLHDEAGELIEIDAGAAPDVLRVHEALADLGRSQPALCTLVELRYFAGLTDDEVAELTGRSLRSVQRDWMKARALLMEILAP
mmetsp:Transcript_25857/g.63785  ORF Transcript_25857/g.63785 Transcript_25857/m.63785 type:complete len:156 (+) Transcript_25857:423-890(+)